jgi:hypothetical protein
MCLSSEKERELLQVKEQGLINPRGKKGAQRERKWNAQKWI